MNHYLCNRFFPHKDVHTKDETDDAIILINSTIPSHFQKFWKTANTKYCADGGANRLHDFFESDIKSKSMYIPDIILGDLDSIRKDVGDFYKNKGAKVIHDPDQDTTDLEKCVMHLPNTIKSTLVLGGLGGNFTQSLANMNVLFKFANRRITLLSDEKKCSIFTSSWKKYYSMLSRNKSWLNSIGY